MDVNSKRSSFPRRFTQSSKRSKHSYGSNNNIAKVAFRSNSEAVKDNANIIYRTCDSCSKIAKTNKTGDTAEKAIVTKLLGEGALK